MRCSFGSDPRVCLRCTAGSHKCVVEGRKARTPGCVELVTLFNALCLYPLVSQRENLLRQIREKNETISVLLNRLRNTSLTTPIAINAARLGLNSVEREMHGEVLSWMERRHALTTQASEKACVAYDTSQLEDDDMYSSSEDDDGNEEDGPENAAVVCSTPASRGPLDPEQLAPYSFLASVSSHLNKSGSTSLARTDLFGIANKYFFQPSKSLVFFFHTVILTRDIQARIPI